MTDKPTHYISIEAGGRLTFGTYVLDATEFIKIGGLKEQWGNNWIPVNAKSIDDARVLAREYRESMVQLAQESEPITVYGEK